MCTLCETDTLDVYLVRLPDRRGAAARALVRVLDFNPWGGATLPLLFTWAELADLAGACLSKILPKAVTLPILAYVLGRGVHRTADTAAALPVDGGDGRGDVFPVMRVVDSPQARLH